MTLTSNDLSETDAAILDVLSEGRVTPQYVADQLELSRPYVSDKLKRFLEHNHVTKLAPGLYALENDPRNTG